MDQKTTIWFLLVVGIVMIGGFCFAIASMLESLRKYKLTTNGHKSPGATTTYKSLKAWIKKKPPWTIPLIVLGTPIALFATYIVLKLVLVVVWAIIVTLGMMLLVIIFALILLEAGI